MIQGSRMRIWKQDPSVKSIGIRTIFVPGKVEDGPKDSEIEIAGMNSVTKDKNNDFLVDPDKDPDKFDAVHTYAVVRRILTQFKRFFRRTGMNDEFTWQWGTNTPLRECSCNRRERIRRKSRYPSR